MKQISKFCSWKKQVFESGDARWKTTTLIAKSSDLPVQTMPLEHLNIYALYPDLESMRNWVGHIKSVLDADLKYPIILDEDGRVMDGRHRIAKALLEDRKVINFVRFKETPPPDYYGDSDDD